jgi:uncharacterized membrane protein
MSTTQPAPQPAPIEAADAPPLLPNARVAPAGNGWTWIVQGWRLFTRAPLMWILSLVILFVCAFALGLVPIVGQIAFQILSPVFAAGLVLACRSLERGGEFELEQLFGGFRRHLGALAVVGVLFLVGELVVFLVFALFAGFGILTAAMSGQSDATLAAVLAASTSILIGGLVAAALMVPLFAAYWFAPALVVMHGMAPIDALKASFVGSFRNFVPFLVYGVVMLVFCIVAAIPFGLGMLVWIPLAFTSSYAAYRDIFTDAPMEI